MVALELSLLTVTRGKKEGRSESCTPPPVAQVLSVQFLLTIASYFIIRKIFVRAEFGEGGGRVN